MALEGADGGVEAAGRQDPLVDELPERRGRGVVIREVDEEEILEPGRGWLVDSGERGREVAEQLGRAARAELVADGRQRLGDGHAATATRGLDDGEMRGLVEEAQREQLARERLPHAGLA